MNRLYIFKNSGDETFHERLNNAHSKITFSMTFDEVLEMFKNDFNLNAGTIERPPNNKETNPEMFYINFEIGAKLKT